MRGCLTNDLEKTLAEKGFPAKAGCAKYMTDKKVSLFTIQIVLV